MRIITLHTGLHPGSMHLFLKKYIYGYTSYVHCTLHSILPTSALMKYTILSGKLQREYMVYKFDAIDDQNFLL